MSNMQLEKIHARCTECGDCLLWQGKTSQAGHPALYGTTGRRSVWETAFGPIPAGNMVTVTCGQILCLNPDHLKLTNKAEVSRINNARLDVKAKRSASSARTNQRNLGKITMDIAREIRASNKLGKDWAAEIGCSATLISHVRCNRTWKETNNPFAGLMV